MSGFNELMKRPFGLYYEAFDYNEEALQKYNPTGFVGQFFSKNRKNFS